jgi:restriction system protein
MQFKMRKNSIFARLLRSPWWISMLIGGTISLAVPVLFASEYAHFGVFIALPFFGIGLVRAYRQMQQPSHRDITMTEESIRGMSPREFSGILTSAYTEGGYIVTPSEDNGADLKLENNGQVTLVSCRRVKAANSGLKPLRALVAAGESQEAEKLIYITMADLSTEARDYASEHGVQILGLETLASMIGKQLTSIMRER